MLRRARKLGKGKRKKKKKKDSSSGSGSSSSSSMDTEAAEGGSSLFSSEKKAKLIWKRCPGALAATSVAEVKARLLTATGTVWSRD